MEAAQRIEHALEAAVGRASTKDAPPQLAAAIRHAVFPGGARVRPQLALAVAGACGDDEPAASEALAVSIELLHCASLIHDDLPCFDDAPLRRGKPSVHCAFSEPIALLAGDAMIVMAFDTLARAGVGVPGRLAGLILTVTRAVGMPNGIVAGQAWESEPTAVLRDYQRAKTGSLFVAASVGGAIAAGADPGQWRTLGDRLGEAYQIADDIRDVAANPEEIGKPVGQDAAHSRPNAVAEVGLAGAVARLEGLLDEAVESIPPCRGASQLKDLVLLQAQRLVPRNVARSAA